MAIDLVRNANLKVRRYIMFIIDRFEGDLVIIEFEGETYQLPKKIFPQDIKEGDVLTIQFKIDKEMKTARISQIKKLEDELFE